MQTQIWTAHLLEMLDNNPMDCSTNLWINWAELNSNSKFASQCPKGLFQLQNSIFVSIAKTLF